MMKQASLLVGVSFALALTACGGAAKSNSQDLGSNPDAGSQSGYLHPLTYREMVYGYAAASCHLRYACCTDDELDEMGNGSAITDEATCVAAYRQIYEESLVMLDALFTDGTLSYDKAIGDACITKLRAAECSAYQFDNYGIWTDFCVLAISGNVAKGGDCAIGLECAPGLRCALQTRKCIELPAIGEPCPDGLCPYGAFCDQQVGGSGNCMALLPVLTQCAADVECQGFDCDAGFCREVEPLCTGR